MKEPTMPACALCAIPAPERVCRNAQGRGPANCPTLTNISLLDEVVATTLKTDGEFWRQSSLQENAAYACREAGPALRRPDKPRIVETVEFARRMGYGRLGLIFCGGLHKEAKVVHQILETNGFEVASVMCKAGGVRKSVVGIAPDVVDGVPCREESICNPTFQAALMNLAETDFNILLGLCVGHDTLAIRALKAPCTVLAVKDRVTGHNPLMPIYLYDSYYKYLKHKLPE